MKKLLLLAALVALSAPAWAGQFKCESLANLKLTHGTVTEAVTVAKGAFKQPAPPPPPPAATVPAGAPGATALGAAGPGGPGARNAELYASLPSFCQVSATLHPVNDSTIKILLWIPVEGWSGRLLAFGTGGFQSSFAYQNMAEALGRGYATTSTDTGHSGDADDFAIGHWDAFIDYEHRAVHEMAVAAKEILAKAAGNQPKYSYFSACSTGGRQALVEAEYHPEDFNGIVAGAASNPMTRIQAGGIWVYQALNRNPQSFISNAKWATVHRAALARCDEIDGLKDGLIDDPRKCDFNPETLLCKGGDADDCLTELQLQAVKKIVAGRSTRAPASRLRQVILSEHPWSLAAGLQTSFWIALRVPSTARCTRT